MSELSDQITTDAQKPQAISADGVTVTRRSLSDQIEVDRYLQDVAATAPANKGPGFRINQIVPSGGPQ
ncbi:MAG TPA: hypothetical protein EYQ63_28210 [Fuerstia sp.]|nr:hypothetical protein [Fuerstiella sp.]